MRIRRLTERANLFLQSVLLAGVLALILPIATVVAGEALEERVQSYWTARSINDLHTLYNLESAAQPGGWLTPDQYQRIGGLPVRDVEVVDTKIDGDQAKVTLQGRVAVGSLGWVPQQITQQWIRIDDAWYHQTPAPR